MTHRPKQVFAISSTGHPQMNVVISRKQFLHGKFCDRAPVAQSIIAARQEESGRADALAIGIHINSLCLSVSGTTCRLCEDECDRQAIDFRLMTAGRSVPMVNESECNGCLDCTSVCPVDAIRPVFDPLPDKETVL